MTLGVLFIDGHDHESHKRESAAAPWLGTPIHSATARASAAGAERAYCRAAAPASGLTSPVDHWLLPTRMQP